MRKIIEDTRFLDRYFTAGERAYLAARAKRDETAAGFFAAKEAFVKALGTGFAGLAAGDVEISHDAGGAPHYLLNEKTRAALEKAGAQRVFLSISHDGDAAMAVAILEGDA